MDEMFIGMALTVIRTVVKNPQKAKKLKTVLLKIRNAINSAFPDE